ncbi:hypothetical protein RRG08_028287 [Elysia crispata]|uniref:Uncharacterized protein n=1 Tax=Elysia crispata TaxID=231223 RepID=A0AAE1AWH8_9GAST|nr:hypothetical protein RRG08_028287 [Elysia crispata]
MGSAPASVLSSLQIDWVWLNYPFIFDRPLELKLVHQQLLLSRGFKTERNSQVINLALTAHSVCTPCGLDGRAFDWRLAITRLRFDP